MADVYVARMWLTCDKSDDDAPAEFDNRFSRELEREWQFVVSDAQNDNSFVAALDNEIWTRCKTHIYGDTGLNSTSVRAFYASLWSLGTGGLHESQGVPILASDASSSAYWTFSYDNGNKTANMLGRCVWSKRTTVSPPS